MASYEQRFYCKNCKKYTTLNSKNQCKTCGSTSINRSWSVRFKVSEKDADVFKRLAGFKTKKEAQEAFYNFQKEQEDKKEVQTEKLRFDKLYEEYKNFTKSRIKETSYYDFCSKCKLHILPFFGDMSVQDLTPKKLLEWQNSINQYSYKYKSCLRTYVMSMLSYAEKYYGIPNQLKNVDNFRKPVKKQEMQVWSPDEFNAFIKCVKKEEFRALFYALYLTGARKGEILATSWSDWDLEHGVLSISKTLSKKVYGASWLVTTPKNQSSIRKISLSKDLVEIMKDFKSHSEIKQFVFFGDKPLADSSIGRVRDEACKKAGVKIIRLHDFRHSHASLLLSQGVSVVAVAKRLGHSNIEQTLNTYAHLMPQEETVLLNVLNNCLK